MALTNAERQAAFKARRAETMDALAQQNAALLAEVAELSRAKRSEGKGAPAGGGRTQSADQARRGTSAETRTSKGPG